MGVVLHRGRKRGSKPINKQVHSGCLANWVKGHPGVLLPRSVSQIADLTGCTKNEVKSYLYRRRKFVKDKIGALRFVEGSGFLYDVDGVMIPCAAMFRVLDVAIDPFTFEGVVRIELKTGQTRTFHESYERFKVMLTP